MILPPMGELDQGQCFRLPLKGQYTLLRTSFHPDKEILWKVPRNSSSYAYSLTRTPYHVTRDKTSYF